MSLSGSSAERDASTGDAPFRYDEVRGPEPTRENPAGVYPDIVPDQQAAPGTIPGSGAPDTHGDVRGTFGNPYEFQQVFAKLSSAFTDAIHAIEDESPSGLGTGAKALIGRLEGMRDEVDGWRAGRGLDELRATGERTDDVSVVDQGGLYKD
ncbi:hypothetical protein Q5752_003855 [Cryptotrichosporon argae]